MRVLVEQTHAVISEALERAGLLWCQRADHGGKVGVHLLMGGASDDVEWNLYPEECAVLVGTQDMLLSRALNRGYASPRARWPLEFGLLSHDALWVLDEVQLMDVGLATSAQLQAFHDEDASKGFRPRLSWWMSATLQPDWLRSVDTSRWHTGWIAEPIAVSAAELGQGIGRVKKTLQVRTIDQSEHRAFARLIADEHAQLKDEGYGRITLVVCNTVERACATADVLRSMVDCDVELVHSRFRPAERRKWREAFLDRSACRQGANRIIVATQVVEAGVDISAGSLITELAPWSCLVQRFGRCARYGGTGKIIVVDRGLNERAALPYDERELAAAWNALQQLEDGGLASLEAFEATLDQAQRAALYPYEPAHLIIRREYEELFDTTPDLTGAHLDIGRFVRSGDERDVQVFWLDIPQGRKGDPPATPPRRYKPRRDELCAIPFLLARSWLCGEETKSKKKPKLRSGMRAWTWDWLDGKWVVATRASIVPGAIVCVAAQCGGYSVDRGFNPEVIPAPVDPLEALSPQVEHQLQADDSEDDEELSVAAWKTIACHGAETADEARAIATTIKPPAAVQRVLELAGRWHDLGKSHPAFQGAIRHDARPQRSDLAKAPDDAWLKPPGSYKTPDDRDSRPGFRHELASALALFAVLERYVPRHEALLGPCVEALRLAGVSVAEPAAAGTPTRLEKQVLDCTADEFDLLAYLVASHHGKVRSALHASPKDQQYPLRDTRGLPIRGIREGDELPSVKLDATDAPLPPLALTLQPAALGLSERTGRSWRERVLDLVARYGPSTLAWLEALLIAADRRASRLQTADPELAPTPTEAT